jgi:hypothetical protein
MNRRSFLAAAAAAAFASATLLRAPEGEAKSDRCGRRTGTTVDRLPQPNARRPTHNLTVPCEPTYKTTWRFPLWI